MCVVCCWLFVVGFPLLHLVLVGCCSLWFVVLVFVFSVVLVALCL